MALYAHSMYLYMYLHLHLFGFFKIIFTFFSTLFYSSSANLFTCVSKKAAFVFILNIFGGTPELQQVNHPLQINLTAAIGWVNKFSYCFHFV